jgi:hypothetical protein
MVLFDRGGVLGHGCMGGRVPANRVEVYRVFSNRLDANHRYMTDKAIRTQMTGKG